MTPDFDVLVIGGGIHGCGVAQVAALAGRSVCVLEKSALAAGTSSRSSKLIHGGLRYLETAQFRLVRESLVERRRLLDAFPSLVQPVPMHLPVYAGMTRRPWQVRAGLALYALLGGGGAQALARAQWTELDGLATDGLLGVFRYQEAKVDDAALTRAVMRGAIAHGATLRMPAMLVAAEVGARGVRATIHDGAATQEVSARVLVNAAGPWAHRVQACIQPGPPPPAIELVQGAHVEYEGAPGHGAYYIESPRDGRPVFVLPRGSRTLVGTTEIAFAGDPDQVHASDDECAYLHEAFATRFPAHAGKAQVARWAGLRVLPAGPTPANRRSRETLLHMNMPGRPRVVGIYGGKLTTWHATATRVMRLLASALG